MLTRCPACETHFRVTAEQLKARSGRVRCGDCQHVFNALDSLIEEPMLMPPPVAEATPPDVAPSLSDAEDAPAGTPAAEVDEIAVPPTPTPEPTPALTPDGQEDVSTSSPSEMEGPPAPEAIEAAEPETVEAIAAETEAPD